MRYRVAIRRNFGYVRPEAEQLDGRVYEFEPGWLIGEEDTNIYIGETAMIAMDKNYPNDAPAWIASGDLVKVGEV